jgi:hypothetical protein
VDYKKKRLAMSYSYIFENEGHGRVPSGSDSSIRVRVGRKRDGAAELISAWSSVWMKAPSLLGFIWVESQSGHRLWWRRSDTEESKSRGRDRRVGRLDVRGSVSGK